MTSEWQDNELGLMHANALWRFNMYAWGESSVALSMHLRNLGGTGKARISFSAERFLRGLIERRGSDIYIRHDVIDDSRTARLLAPEARSRLCYLMIHESLEDVSIALDTRLINVVICLRPWKFHISSSVIIIHLRRFLLTANDDSTRCLKKIAILECPK